MRLPSRLRKLSTTDYDSLLLNCEIHKNQLIIDKVASQNVILTLVSDTTAVTRPPSNIHFHTQTHRSSKGLACRGEKGRQGATVGKWTCSSVLSIAGLHYKVREKLQKQTAFLNLWVVKILNNRKHGRPSFVLPSFVTSTTTCMEQALASNSKALSCTLNPQATSRERC